VHTPVSKRSGGRGLGEQGRPLKNPGGFGVNSIAYQVHREPHHIRQPSEAPAADVAIILNEFRRLQHFAICFLYPFFTSVALLLLLLLLSVVPSLALHWENFTIHGHFSGILGHRRKRRGSQNWAEGARATFTYNFVQ